MARETIFIKILKDLLIEKLMPLSTSQRVKSQTIGYDKILSAEQQRQIDILIADIIKFESSATDQEATEEIIKLINETRTRIQPKRQAHNQQKDNGETITCLNKLANNSKDFYVKVNKLKADHPEQYSFTLLNVLYKKCPLHLVYGDLALYYLGEEIFTPESGDSKTRTAKEDCLAKRLKALNERILPQHGLKDQQSRAIEIVEDLKKDNKGVVAIASSPIKSAVSRLSLWGVSLNPNGAKEGRLRARIDTVLDRIKEMEEKDFEPLIEHESGEELLEENLSGSALNH